MAKRKCSAPGCDSPHYGLGFCRTHHARWTRLGAVELTPKPSLKDRFLAKVDKGDGPSCWEWTGARYRAGYGKFGVNEKTLYAHRVAYELLVGPIPDGLYVLHRCDNPPCVRPDHLFLGTRADNMADMSRKGRSPHAQKTHCPKGHPYDAANTGSRSDRPRARVCRECERLALQRWYAKNRDQIIARRKARRAR